MRIASYNCRGLPKRPVNLHTRPDVSALFDKSDIICFQETWLAKQELELCDGLHERFAHISAAKVDFTNGILIGRPHGGVTIFYDKRLENYVSPLLFQNCDWCVGLTFTYDTVNFTILNVYLPYETSSNEDEFLDKLSLLESYIDSINQSSLALIGDFNSNIKLKNGRITSKFAKYVIDFCDRNELTSSSQELLPADSYTYISERWAGSTSWLDLVCASTDFHNSIRELKIEYDLTYNVSFDLCTTTLPKVWPSEPVIPSKGKVCWRKMLEEQISLYTTFTDLICNQTNFDSILPVCSDINCNCPEHRDLLSVAYDKFINCLNMSASKACTFTKNSTRPPGKPGWTTYVKEKHEIAIQSYKIWRDNGKPRQGPIFDLYHRNKLSYKYAVRAIKRNIDNIKADNAASKLQDSDYSGFWNSIKKFNKRKNVLPQQIGDAVGEKDICNQWKSHFSNIYNSVPRSGDNIFHRIAIYGDVINVRLFTEVQLLIAISKLDNNKSSGYDSIVAEHVKYCSTSMIRVLTRLLNSFLLHGFLPQAFMPVLISPIFKKGGSVTDIDSYRPIALANCISKLFEALLRDKLFDYLETSDNQFGYKRKSGTDMCLYTFKEIIDCYNKLNSNIYCCFLDASRAYDRVSHNTLFKMLSDRKVPPIYIRILAFWYKYQQLYVRWGNVVSSAFTVTNGVRQGSVLSPYLFCVYFDKISKALIDLKIGCKLRGLLINHLFYADDLCIFCPSSHGLQRLLNMCFESGSDLDIIFNETKCKIMVFKCKSFRKCSIPTFNIGGHDLKVCSSYKYLGHIICDSLSDKLDISRQCRSIYAKGNSLIRTFYKCSDDVKVTLFKTYCSSLYTNYLWSNYTQSDYRKITVAYHSVFKKFLNYPRNTSNRFLFVHYKVPTFGELMRKSISSFKNRVRLSNNDLVNSANERAWSSLSRRWDTLLY